MSRLAVLSLSLILLLAVLPLTSFGTTNDQPVLWWLGLGALLIGGLLPPATRFGLGSDEEEE
jgi:hypothetical protein